MLRYQINPHFLFNSLNSIKALAFENPEQASFMITELSEFLRITLSYNDKIFIPVSEEIEIIEKYLTIEKIRFEERLDYNISVDSTLIDKKILCFITQPLVENAIKHGMAYKPDGIRLSVFFRQIDQCIAIEIVNEGKLIENGNSTGTGLKNVRERLENAYFKEYILTMTEEGQFVKVRLLLPEIT